MSQRSGFNIRKFIKRAAFITLILALAEVAIIFFIMSGKKRNAPPGKVVSTKELSKAPAPDVHKNLDSASPQNKISTISADSFASKALPAAKNEVAAPTAVSEVQPSANEDAQAVNLNKDTSLKKPVTVPVMQTLSQARMIQVYNNIVTEKKRYNNKLNCVQIRKTTGSNVDNAFKIAQFLKARGYIISGRMTIPGNQKGIKVNAQTDCVMVTIGSL